MARSLLPPRLRTILGIVVLDFVVLETLVTLFAPYNSPAKPRNKETFVVSSPTRVHQFIPNATFTYDRAVYQTNSIGYRDREFSLKKPAGTLRFAVVGDSYIEGMGEEQSATIPKELERSLTARAHRPVEVMNCGVRGGSPATYQYWVQHIASYSPDAVVICVADNDLEDDALALLVKTMIRARAWYALPSWLRWSNVVSYIEGECAVIKFKSQRKNISRTWFGEDDFKKENGRKDGETNQPGANTWGFCVDPEKWRVHWERTQENLDATIGFLRAKRIPAVIVFIPANSLFPARPMNNPIFKKDPFADWVEGWAEERHLPVVNLVPLLQKWYGNSRHDPLFNPAYSHFSPKGLAWVANQIEPALLTLLQLSS